MVGSIWSTHKYQEAVQTPLISWSPERQDGFRFSCYRGCVYTPSAGEVPDDLLAEFSDEEKALLELLPPGPRVGSAFIYRRQAMAACESLHGGGPNAQDPDHKKWIKHSGSTVAKFRYVALSYKHMHWLKRERSSDGCRFPKMPEAECQEVIAAMEDLGYTKYWHDGAKKRWRGTKRDGEEMEDETDTHNGSCARGMYPYIIDGCMVLVVPPRCREEVPDPSTWVSMEFPNAQAAFAECVRYEFKQGRRGPYLARRNVPGVPSVAWGSMMRVWMLAESFCGCLHGRIRFTTKGGRRMQAFIQEIRTVMLMVEFFIERGDSNPPARKVSLAERFEQLYELKELLKDVVTYYRMVVDASADRGAMALSSFFLERMAFAGVTNNSDRLVVASMCAMMLQQVFGHKMAMDDAISQYEKAPDALAFAVMVASSGNHAFPLTATTQQRRGSTQALLARTIGSYYQVKSEGALLSQWPQPVGGPCYAGALTTAPLKYIFWHGLTHNRGLGLEAPLEKVRSDVVKASEAYKNLEAESLKKREKHFRRRGAFSSARIGKMVNQLVLWDPTHPKNGVYMPLDEKATLKEHISEEQRGARLEGFNLLVSAWNRSQTALLPVIGDRLPVLFGRDNCCGIAACYVLDTRDIKGQVRAELESSNHPVVVSHSSEKLFLTSSESIAVKHHPLLQLVLNLPKTGEQGYLIAMRRVWDITKAGGMPARPVELVQQMVEKRCCDHVRLLERDGSEDDWIFPTRVCQEGLADYSGHFEAWHAPGMITQPPELGRAAEQAPEKWAERWSELQEALSTPWEQEIGTWKSSEIDASPSRQPNDDASNISDSNLFDNSAIDQLNDDSK